MTQAEGSVLSTGGVLDRGPRLADEALLLLREPLQEAEHLDSTFWAPATFGHGQEGPWGFLSSDPVTLWSSRPLWDENVRPSVSKCATSLGDPWVWGEHRLGSPPGQR